jgi:hypothetical protein
VEPLADDHLRHGDQGGGVGGRLDEHVLVCQRDARTRPPRVEGDDARPMLLGPLEIFVRAGAERAVARAPSPHPNQLRVDEVGRFPSGALVVGVRAVGHAHGEHLGLRRHVRPQFRAAPEHVEETLRRGPPVQHRQAARARGIEYGRITVAGAHAFKLRGDPVEGLVPGYALEAAAAAGSIALEGKFEAIGMIDALDLADTAGAGMQWRQLGLPAARVGRDLDDPTAGHVGVDDASAAAVVTAGAGDDGLPRRRCGARSLIDRPPTHARSSSDRACSSWPRDPVSPADGASGRLAAASLLCYRSAPR